MPKFLSLAVPTKDVGNSSFSLVDSSRAKYRSGLYLCIHFSRHQILSCLGCQGTYVPKQELRLVTNCTKPKSADPVGSLTCVLARVECQRYNKLSSLVGKPDVQRKELVLKGVMTVKRRSARSESDVDLRLFDWTLSGDGTLGQALTQNPWDMVDRLGICFEAEFTCFTRSLFEQLQA